MEKENNLKNFKYIVYETTNLINGKIYVGVHQTEDPNTFDNYLGCGAYANLPGTYNKAKFSFHKALIKYGPKNFRRKTLAVFDSPEPAYLLEEELVNEEFLKREDVYNMVLGGEGGYFISNRIKVYYYDLEGNYVGEFDSMAIAGLNLGCDYTAVSYAVRKKTKCCNYYWSTDKLDKIDLNDYNVCDNHRVPVYQYSLTGDFVAEFPSMKAAEKGSGVCAGAISRSCLTGESAGGYYFCKVKAENYSIAKTEYIKNRPVYKYNSDGSFAKAYEHQQDAEAANKGSNISKAIRLKIPCKNGFLWGLVKLENYNVPRKQNAKKRVGKYDLEGNLIGVYPSATAAANANGTSVWKVLAGTNQTHKKHVYKYLTS